MSKRTHGILRRSSVFFFGMKFEYSIETPLLSIEILSLYLSCMCAMSSASVRSFSMKKRSQIVHSVS